MSRDLDPFKVRELVLSGEGRARLAAAMVAPLKRRMDYSGVARKAFGVEPLCKSCGKTVEEGAAAGCPECVTRSVMES